jgi:hypothetical protein
MDDVSRRYGDEDGLARRLPDALFAVVIMLARFSFYIADKSLDALLNGG